MLQTVFNILKITAIIAIAAVFLVAINTILNLIVTLVFDNVVGEVLRVISTCLPFNAANVFGLIGTACAAILAFLVARKIFDLTSWSISSV